MTHIDKVISVLLDYIIPDDIEDLKATIAANSCPMDKKATCSGCQGDMNKRIRCWKGEDE